MRDDIIEAIAKKAKTDPKTVKRVLGAFKAVKYEAWGDDFTTGMTWINDGWRGHHEVLGHVLDRPA